MAAAGGATGALHSFFCTITDELMQDPVCTADGHTYERAAIEEWLAGHDTSPTTGVQLPYKNLTPNHALRKSIDEWQENFGMHLRRADIVIEGSPIAAGSFKTVYKGSLRVHAPGGASKTVVVAVLKMRKGDCATEAGMFLKLGRHPRLVRFFGQCVDGEDQLMVTEFAKHGSLLDCFEMWEETITLVHNVAIMQQIAQGMEHLSAEGIIHRDLAARNVLVMSFDESDALKTSVKITDYGLAAGSYNRSHVTIAPVQLPTRYMSPEALQRGRFSQYSDVWACGVLFWCFSHILLTLPPFLPRAHSLSLAHALLSLAVVLSASISLSFSLSLSLSHTQGIFLFLSLFLCFFFRTNTRTTSTGKFCLSCSLPESLSFFLSLSFCLSHAHTYTQGNADARKHSLFRIDSRSRNHRTRLCRRHIAPPTQVRQKLDSFRSLFHITELFPSL